MKLVRLIKLCLNETYNKVRMHKNLSCISYPEWGGALFTLVFKICFRICHQEHISSWSLLTILIC